MKRSLLALIGFGIIIVLALIVLINSFNPRRLDQTTPTGSIIVPTSVPLELLSSTQSSSPLINDVKTLSSEDRSTLKTIQLSLPVEDSDIGIAYSPITEQFIVQKKTSKADELLNQFLQNNQLTDLYTKHPEYFVVSNRDLHSEIMRVEDEVISLITDDDEEDLVNPTVIPNKNDPSTQFQPITNVFKSLMGFGLTTLPAQSPQTNINSSTASGSLVSRTKSSSNLDAAVKNSCYKFLIKKCGGNPGTTEVINESRPGVAYGTYPVDQTVLNELFSNPNAVGLYSHKKEFEKGLIHPLLMNFLNEFAKKNTIDKHLGISGYGDGRCCARNGHSKTPALGCSLTPHRLGVAIDLGVVNGTDIRKNNASDPNYRRALDWINAQTGALRPDNVTFSDAFTGIYPTDLFHPDSGHRDHLHIDYRRSLSCQ